MLSLDDFLCFGNNGFNLVPVWKCIELPKSSPLIVYQHLANQGNDYLFETGGFKHGQFAKEYSIIGLPCAERIELTGNQVRRLIGKHIVLEKQHSDPLGVLQEILAEIKVPSIKALPNFSGGLFGYFGFDTIRMIEPRLARQTKKPTPLDVPDVLQLISKELVIFDHKQKKAFCIVHAEPTNKANYHQALSRVDQIEKALQALPSDSTTASLTSHTKLDKVTEESPKQIQFHFPKKSFETAVGNIKEYIKAGDVMQVVLSQRMTQPMQANALDFYQALTSISQTPYSYLMNTGNCQIVGASPEMLVQQQDSKVVSRPMAGTRRRGADKSEDNALQTELLADAKEVAEHMMLVDLARNDLGRLADTGSVTVEKKMTVEHFSHVMHIVSTVTGKLDQQVSGINVLKSTFPAGTLSGASKVRAMEVINELEPYSRSIYGGALGYLGWGKAINLAITIRTGIICDGLLHMQAGAGVVLDSTPEREWQETIEKSQVLVSAATYAETIHKNNNNSKNVLFGIKP